MRLPIILIIIFAAITVPSLVTTADTVDKGVGNQLLTNSIYTYGDYQGNAEGCRQLNGTIWFFTVYRNPSDATLKHLMGSYSSDNGSNWTNITLIDSEDAGFETGGFPNRIYGAVVLSNNSIILFVELYAYDTTDNIELHFYCHWNNSDLTQWELAPLLVSETYDHTGFHMAVNDTDQILALYKKIADGTFLYDHFDPSDRSLTRYGSTQVPQTGAWVVVNSTGDFLIALQMALPSQKFYLKTADGTWTTIYVSGILSSTYNVYHATMTEDDTLIYCDQRTDGGWLDINFWNSTSSGSRRISTTTPHIYCRLGLSGNTSTYVHIWAYQTTVDKFIHWEANYYDDPLIWQASEEYYFSETDGLDRSRVCWVPNDIYPKIVDGAITNLTQIPTGTYGTFYLRECDSGDGSHNYDMWEIHDTGITWPGIVNWTYFPEGGGPGPGPDPDPDTVPGGGAVIDPNIRISFYIETTFNGIIFTPEVPTGQIAINYTWDFGDGTLSTAEEPLHYYREPRRYNVTLSVHLKYVGAVMCNAFVMAPEPSTFQKLIKAFELDDKGLIVYIGGGHLTIPPLVLLFMGFLIIGNVYFWSEVPVRGWRFVIALLGGALMLIAIVISMGGAL